MDSAPHDPPNLPSAAELRREMQEIRQQMSVSVDRIVAGAEELVDWRQGVRRHPWVAVAAAAVLGYWVVPRRQPPVTTADPEVLARLVKEQHLQLETPSPRPGLLTSIMAAGGSLLLRAGTSYLIKQLSAPARSPSPSNAPDLQETSP